MPFIIELAGRKWNKLDLTKIRAQTVNNIPEDDEQSDDKENTFISLEDLLKGKKHEIGLIAKAIELHGVYTWDRFDRFGLADESAKTEALNLLAKLAEWRTTGRGMPPLEEAYGMPENPYGWFGWPSDACPDFDSIDIKEKTRQQKSGIKKIEQSLYKIIAGLAFGAKIQVSERGAARRVKDLIEQIGMTLDEETILKRLREVDEFRKENEP